MKTPSISLTAAITRISEQRRLATSGLLAKNAQDSLRLSAQSAQVRFASAGTVSGKAGYVDELQKRGVLVAGAGGIMGSGIAQNTLTADIPVYLQEFNEAFAQQAQKGVEASILKARDKGVFTPDEANRQVANVKGAIGNLEANIDQVPQNVGLVIEAIIENLDAKKDLFRRLDAHLAPDAIIASNTSTLSITELAQATQRPDKVIGIHFFKPANINRFVEIIKTPYTSQETVEKAMAYVRALGKSPVVCQDAPGFVVNRLGIPLVNEGVKMLEEGLANTTTIDRVALETLWPTYHRKFKGLGEKVLLPFNGTNQDNYMLIMGQTATVIHNGLKHRYGEAYRPTQTILEKSAAYQQIANDARKQGLSKEQFEAKLAGIKFAVGHEAVAADKKDAVRDRFLGMVFGIATQLLDEGVTTPSDIDRGVQVGLAWEVGPFELMNKLGLKKALQLVEAYAATNPGFKVADSLVEQVKQGKPFELSFVDSRREGATQYITLNRPQKLNALNSKALSDLRKAFRAAEKDPGVHTIVFESAGGKAFVSGADIFELEDRINGLVRTAPGPKPLRPVTSLPGQVKLVNRFLKQGRSVFDEIAQSKKTTVAKVNGVALGGGTELALACDYVIASEKATFGLPEVKYGIFPAWGGTYRLPRKIGEPLAKWMVLEGGLMGDGGEGPAILNGKTAHAIGLADYVVPAAKLEDATREILRQEPGLLKQKPPAPDAALQAKAERYAKASVEELLANELKGLHPGAVKLALASMVRRKNTLPTGDLIRMMLNMQAVQKQGKHKA